MACRQGYVAGNDLKVNEAVATAELCNQLSESRIATDCDIKGAKNQWSEKKFQGLDDTDKHKWLTLT